MNPSRPTPSTAEINAVLIDAQQLRCPVDRAWALLGAHRLMDLAQAPAPLRQAWQASWRGALHDLRPPLRAAFERLRRPPAGVTLRHARGALGLGAAALLVRAPLPRAALLVTAALTARRAWRRAGRDWRATLTLPGPDAAR